MQNQEQKDQQLFTAVQDAQKGNLRSVQEALNNGADINAQNEYGSTALQIAIAHAHAGDGNNNDSDLGLVRFLIKQRDIDVNIQDNDRCTALHWAAQKNSGEKIKVLLAAGVDIAIKNNDNKTPLELSQNEEIKKILEAQEKLFSATNEIEATAALKEGAAVNAKQDGRTPLHFAAKNGNVETLQVLLDQEGIDVTIKSKSNETVLEELDKFLNGNTGEDLDVNKKQALEAIKARMEEMSKAASQQSLVQSSKAPAIQSIPPVAVTSNQGSSSTEHTAVKTVVSIAPSGEFVFGNNNNNTTSAVPPTGGPNLTFGIASKLGAEGSETPSVLNDSGEAASTVSNDKQDSSVVSSSILDSKVPYISTTLIPEKIDVASNFQEKQNPDTGVVDNKSEAASSLAAIPKLQRSGSASLPLSAKSNEDALDGKSMKRSKSEHDVSSQSGAGNQLQDGTSFSTSSLAKRKNPFNNDDHSEQPLLPPVSLNPKEKTNHTKRDIAVGIGSALVVAGCIATIIVLSTMKTDLSREQKSATMIACAVIAAITVIAVVAAIIIFAVNDDKKQSPESNLGESSAAGFTSYINY